MASQLLKRAAARRTWSDRPANPAMVLAIILGCYLMVVLDASVVITALPNIRADLGFSPSGLSWVQNAYTLTFGGLLLLGARAGDLLGRRQVFIVGILLFTAASMLGGLAQSETWLLTARAVQGIGAAIAAPSTLALLTVSFPEGSERTRAIALYSAVASAGASIGLVLGGMLTTWISWRWGLFINVPIGIALAVLAPAYLPETERHTGAFDLSGAATSTLGMGALVYGLVRAAESGWGDAVALGSFAASAVLLASFVTIEQRARQPITPLRLFASRERVGAYAARMLVVGAMFGMFFYLTQFLQGAEGYSALKAGLAFLPVSLSVFAMVRVVPKVLGRFGLQRTLLGGLVLALGGLLWLSRTLDHHRLLDRRRAADGAGRQRDGPRLHAADPGGRWPASTTTTRAPPRAWSTSSSSSAARSGSASSSPSSRRERRHRRQGARRRRADHDHRLGGPRRPGARGRPDRDAAGAGAGDQAAAGHRGDGERVGGPGGRTEP